ncbi:MAG: 2-hydroxyacyl-CoA dehydratase [Candidatus Lokiarchaeota archaeon]|nr:2-hydroxyacyl-CoA dehydratase [Candidatus Lokiarchaeota archaeon]
MMNNMSFNQNQDFLMQSVLDIGMQYINGFDIIKSNRKKGKKILAGFLPPMELGLISRKTVPFFLPRFTEFPFQSLMKFFRQVNKLGCLKAIINFWFKNEGFIKKINSSRTNINAQALTNGFSDLNLIAEQAKFYLDSCVQTRVCYGAYLKYRDYFDLLFGGLEGNYCLHFAKFYERIGFKKPVFYFEKPYGDEKAAYRYELVLKELEEFFKKVEEMTNESIDFNYVKEKMKLVNETRKIAALIQNRYYNRGYVPLHAGGSTLISGAYTDYLSDINFFQEKMRLLVREIENNIKAGIIRNYKKEGIPRILIAGSPGFDPELPTIIKNNGGCLLYLDIFSNSKYYELIDLTGDFLEKYAKFLLRVNFEKGTEDLVEYWIDKAKQIDADGVVFNEVWGCRFITPSFKLLKDRIRDELEIPVVGINFHNFGENLGQINTRIGAFMELIK